MARFSPKALSMLERAGWFEGRSQATAIDMARNITRSGGFVLSEAATRVLLEFGGLRIGTPGTGEKTATSSVELVPILAEGEEDRFSAWREDRCPALFPLGEINGGHAFLAIHPDGSVYAVGDGCWRIASTFDEAVEVLTRGLGSEGVPEEVPTLPLEQPK